jgi:hypothetical protein
MRRAIYFWMMGAFALLVSNTAKAQSFSVQFDTVKAVVSGTPALNNKVTTTSSTPIKITWQVTYHNLPIDWQSAIGLCDNNLCYGNTILGTSATPPNPPFVAPGDSHLTDTFGVGNKCDFHIQCNFTPLSSGGPYYITIKLTEGTTIKYMTYALTKWATGISNTANAAKEVNVYPNPARDEVNVVYDKSLEIKNIAVVNLIGKVVKYYRATDDSGAKLNIDNMASGVYLINLIDAQGHTVATKRFAVIQ